MKPKNKYTLKDKGISFKHIKKQKTIGDLFELDKMYKRGKRK